jgi:hypothetical protein
MSNYVEELHGDSQRIARRFTEKTGRNKLSLNLSTNLRVTIPQKLLNLSANLRAFSAYLRVTILQKLPILSVNLRTFSVYLRVPG